MKTNKQKMFLKAAAIFKYLTGDDKLHTLVTTKNTEVDLITTDQSLYEAIGSVKDRDEININLLVKLLEVTQIVPYEQATKNSRRILTEERVEQIRKNITDDYDNKMEDD